MIDTRPFPGVGNVKALLAAVAPISDTALAARWALLGDKTFWLSRSSWGMAALANAFRARFGRPPRVWMPEYFCDQALWPLRAQAAELVFYSVDARAWPDWAASNADFPPDLFFLVHFYGHASDIVRARAFCDAAGALLVEDATHALGPDDIIGHAGDVVFYSPWKFFEVPNGAVMLIRPRATEWTEPVTAAVADLGARPSLGLNWMKDVVLSKLPGIERRTHLATFAAGDFLKDAPVQAMSRRPRASPVTKPLLANVQLAGVGDRRRANDASIRAYVADLPGWRPLDPVPARGPLRSAFVIDSPERAETAHRALRRAGIRAEGWPGLPAEVAATTMATRLRQTVINLPCHQGLTPDVLQAALGHAGLTSF